MKSFSVFRGLWPATLRAMGAGSSEEYPVGEGGLAEAKESAACCSARSLREAFPLFLRSRKYSQVSPNSNDGLARSSFKDLGTHQRNESTGFHHHTWYEADYIGRKPC